MPFGIEFLDKDEGVGEITIYGDIQDTNFFEIDGVTTPKYFKDQFDKFKNKSRINIFMNTGGGGIYAGMAIHSNLVRSKADTWGYVDGIAASIGSVVLQGCKHRVVYENSMVMIHDPYTPVFGCLDANNARRIADDLDKCKDSIVAIFKGKSNVDETEIRRMMSQETLMVGKEITNLGFADILEGAKDYQNHIENGNLYINGQPVNLSFYKAIPKNLFSIVEKTFQKGAPQNPYPNEHAARVRDPDDFKKDSFRRKNIEDGIDIIIGKLKSGGDSMETQAYRFKASKFTAEQAKKWLKDHDVKYISFEPASEKEEDHLDFPNLKKAEELLNKLKNEIRI